MNEFIISYVTTLPKSANAPYVKIVGDYEQTYHVSFNDNKGKMLGYGYCKNNQILFSGLRQWYTDWHIVIRDEKKDIVFEDFFNASGKVVFVKIDGYALGDNIAWIPYIEEFRKKHNCIMICSTFHNDLFVDSYPNILFVKPNTVIENVYAQYYIGAENSDNFKYSPIMVNDSPLQMVSSSILGLPYKELVPNLGEIFKKNKRRHNKKYVTLSEYGSTPLKHWREENGWQMVVDYLVNKGYDVLVISKEPTNLKNIIDLTGDISLIDRAIDICHADYHFGISSGLSWLAWALGTHVVMISDNTPIWHEFLNNTTRFCEPNLNSVDYQCVEYTKIDNVIKRLDEMIV